MFVIFILQLRINLLGDTNFDCSSRDEVKALHNKLQFYRTTENLYDAKTVTIDKGRARKHWEEICEEAATECSMKFKGAVRINIRN